MRKGFILAAPHSGSGKTTVTLALLRLLARQNIPVSAFKTGPDYIDPGYHSQALMTEPHPASRPCYNLDSWAMPQDLIGNIIHQHPESAGQLHIAEGVMGLFDGSAIVTPRTEYRQATADSHPIAPGSTAELSLTTGWPIILVISARHQAQSLAALIHGFITFHPAIQIAGILINHLASARHKLLIEQSLAHLEIPVLGYLPYWDEIALPDRHLGLLPAGEITALSDHMDRAADWLAQYCQIDSLLSLAKATDLSPPDQDIAAAPPLGQHIAIARDAAFCFSYPHWLHQWHQQGRHISYFSPLADEAPHPQADAIFLPGGYPELHAETLAVGHHWQAGLHQAAAQGAWIYGECGGYMVLGHSLECAKGQDWPMLNMLPVRTSFRQRQRHLGYRLIHLADQQTPLAALGSCWRGHEFHYATILPDTDQQNESVFAHILHASQEGQSAQGHQSGRILGSFMHLIAPDMLQSPHQDMDNG